VMGDRESKGAEQAVISEEIITQYTIREEMKHSVRILLAEDNPVNQKLATMMLRKAGYQVEVANNGREAVEQIAGSPDGFDLIFMDIQMPEMDGIAATREIRNLKLESQNIPIVAMTAHAMKGDMEMCLEAGMDDYIAKPIKRDIVLSILEKWVFNKSKL
jgi:two-component system sensor histidine kinase/response regulator